MNAWDKSFFERFGLPGVKKYVFGINEYADNIAAQFEIDGFIDEFTTELTHRGKPILKLADVPKQSMIVSSVTSARPRTALEKLRGNDFSYSIDYFRFADASAGRIEQIKPIAEMRTDFHENVATYQWLRGLLADQQSVNTFDRVMEFRLGGSLYSLNDFSCRIDEQYFEPFLALKPGEVFVDGGGYDGFTTLEFVKRCPKYGAVHFFEPSNGNITLAKNNLTSIRNIVYHNVGLFDAKTRLQFDAGQGSGSRISEAGSEVVAMDTLDDTVSEKVSFIKLDLEGAEIAALRGMSRHLKEDHPKLAVAVYHDPSHFRQIPKIILGIRDDYKVYLRHYTESWTETIMFFIPK